MPDMENKESIGYWPHKNRGGMFLMDSRIIPVILHCVCAMIHVAKERAAADANIVRANTG